jgi:hypothetical protein
VSGLIRIKDGADAGDLAHGVLDQVVANLRRPDYRAGLAVTALTMAVLARLGARPGPALVISLLAGNATERLYGTITEINAKLDGGYAREAPEPLVFHCVPGCPGHVIGSPEALAKDCPDATGKV